MTTDDEELLARAMASSECPICGVDTPHAHTEEEQIAYHDDQIRNDGWTSVAIWPREPGLYLIRGHQFPSEDAFRVLRSAYTYDSPREEVACYEGGGWWKILYQSGLHPAYVHPTHWTKIPDKTDAAARIRELIAQVELAEAFKVELLAKYHAERKAREEAEALLAGQTHIAEQLLGRGAGDDAYIIGLQEKLATAESRLAQAESAGMERAAQIVTARFGMNCIQIAAAIRAEVKK